MVLSLVSEYDETAIGDIGEHAVVVGGSMAGLLAARVLADGYDRVTVIERDQLPDEPVARGGVPQGNHVHVLLEAGRVILSDLFPGYQDELESAGGLTIDVGQDLTYYDQGDVIADPTEALEMCCASRPLYEQLVRRRLTKRDGVGIRSDCHFRNYLADRSGSRITGIEITNEAGTEETIDAELVVDATGRTSRTTNWLRANGYPTPTLDRVSVDLAYSTAVVDRPASETRSYLCAPWPSQPAGGAVVPIEDEQWLVTLFGLHGNHPPTDRDGFIQFAEKLAVPEIATLLRTNDWRSSEITHYPFPANQWRHYEELSEFPAGLLVTGDAIVSFNPIYGQGMSVAALDALQLHNALSDGTGGLAIRFFSLAANHLDTVWRISVGSDFEFPETTGPKPIGTDLLNRYISRLIRTAHSDSHVATEFLRVLRLEQPPTALFHPKVAGRVLWPS